MNFPAILTYFKKNYILGICGFVSLVCLGIYIVRSEQITRLAADYDDLDIRRTRILKNLKFASDIEADLQEAQAFLKDAEGRLFSPEDLATNQRYFYEVESATGVQMKSIQQVIKDLPDGKRDKKARKKAAKSNFQEIIYDMNIQGTYENVLTFMRELEGGKAFMVLEAVSMIPVKAVAGEPEVSVRLSVTVLGKKMS